MPSTLFLLFTFLVTALRSDQQLSINITCVPPSGSGEDSWGVIRGQCNCIDIDDIVNNSSSDGVACGIDWSRSYSVVIWSKTDRHYIQPWANDYYTSINSKGRWSAGIHLGWSYRVDLVEFRKRDNIIDYDTKSGSLYDEACIGICYSSSFAVFAVMLLLLFAF
eukprot:297375_1